MRSSSTRQSVVSRTVVCSLALSLAGVGCSYQNPLSQSGQAFRSGSAAWGTLSLGQTYAVTLREAKEDCFMSLFDIDSIAAKAYERVDATTRTETQKIIDSVYQDQRRQLGSSYPGEVLFQAEGGDQQVLLPAMHRAYRSPLDECPNRPPEMRGVPLQGDVEGVLQIEFPLRGKLLEMRARLNERGGRIVSIPVLREVGGSVFEAPVPPPPPPLTAPAPPTLAPIQGKAIE